MYWFIEWLRSLVPQTQSSDHPAVDWEMVPYTFDMDWYVPIPCCRSGD